MSIPKDERTPGLDDLPDALNFLSEINAHSGAWCFIYEGEDGNSWTQGSTAPDQAAASVCSLREALAPFAAAHESFEAGLDDCTAEYFDNSEICDGVTWGDLRRARAALSTLPVNDRHHSGSDNARLREAENTFGADTDDDVTDWGQENIEENARADRQNSDDVGRLRDALAGLEMLYERPGEDSIEQFERIGDVFYKQTGYLRPGKDCRLHDPEVRSAVWRKWIDAKIDAARAALKGVPQPASDDYQADASAPALSEKFNVRSEWRPIETAPKGRKIICGFLNGAGKWRTVMGQYIRAFTMETEDGWGDEGEDAFYVPEGWYEDVYTEEIAGETIHPTHWMPLPSPPGAELNFSNEAERDAVSLKPDTSSQPASEAGKLSTDEVKS